MLRSLLLRLPAPIRHRLMRRMFRFDPDRCERYEVRPAQTVDEYLAAQRLLHQIYDDAGFYRSGDFRRQTDRRLYFQQVALPTSTILIALDQGRVVGTTTMIRDSAMGLPGTKIFGSDVARIARRGERMIEMSMLAVHPEYRKGGEVLFALQRYAGIVSMDYQDVDLALCIMQPVIADAMRGLMLFEPLMDKQIVHPLSLLTFDGIYLDYRTIGERSRAPYRNAPKHRDLRKFMLEDGRERVRFPSPPWRTTLFPKLPPKQFAAVFGEPDDLHWNTSELDRLVLRNAYSPAFRAELPEWFPAIDKPERETRYDANVPATVSGARGEVRRGTARLGQISAHGGMLTTTVPLQLGDSVEIEAAFSPERSARVQATIVRQDESGRYGAFVAEPDATWLEYVEFLEGWLWRIGPAAEAAAAYRD